MFDHVLMFADEAEARAALPAYGRETEGVWRWAANVIAPQRVVTARAVVQVVDGMPQVVTPEQTVPGYFLTICLPALDATLRDMPGMVCRLIGDRNGASIVYTAPDLNPALLSAAIIEPVPAGASYLQGQP